MRVRVWLITILFIPLFAFASEKKLPSWCQESGYHCVKVKSGQSWKSIFPDENQRDIVMRINHTNQGMYSGKIIKVPNDPNFSDLLAYSPMPRTIDPPGEKEVIFNPKIYAWGAYDADGNLVRWGPASGGSGYCRDLGHACRTKVGTFRVYSLGSAGCVSTKFPVGRGGAPMPYCMFFNNGQALHGSPGEVQRGNVSHGCVRLFVDDAKWLRFEFIEGPNAENGYKGTKVIVMPY